MDRDAIKSEKVRDRVWIREFFVAGYGYENPIVVSENCIIY